jgi:acyl carrier protein
MGEMDTAAITDEVIKIIAKHSSAKGKITVDSTLKELNMDSLDAMNVVFGVEEKFEVSVPDELVRNLKTVGQIVEEIQRLEQQKAADATRS